jgi:hypothetical protein
MGVQNEIVRDNIVQHCPRLGTELSANKCVKYCKFCRGYLLSVSFRIFGSDDTKKEIYTVVCDYPHLREFPKHDVAKP